MWDLEKRRQRLFPASKVFLSAVSPRSRLLAKYLSAGWENGGCSLKEWGKQEANRTRLIVISSTIAT